MTGWKSKKCLNNIKAHRQISNATCGDFLSTYIMAVGVVLSLGMVWGDGGIIMTLCVALFGLFHFSVNSLTQAAAMDLVAGRQLESTFIGLLWGSNAAFGAIAALLAGVLVGVFVWDIAFYLSSGFFLIGFLVSLGLPSKSKHV